MAGRSHTANALAAVLALYLAGTAQLACASVIGSPHDLHRHGYLVVVEEVLKRNPQCNQCHFDSQDERPLIWQAVPQSMSRYGQAGTLCASCHDGVSMVDRNVDAGLTVFHPLSHGLNAAQAPSFTTFGESGLGQPVDERFSCLTCHNPHEQAIRPFLRVPFSGICVRCHAKRKGQGYNVDNLTGDHPVDIEPYDNTEGASPIEVGQEFSIPFPQQYPQSKGILSTNAHWRAGGHLSQGSYGKIECTTCHAFHGNESRGPAQDLLAKDPVLRIADEFCEGCHQGERGDDEEEPPYPNPGGTTTGRTYHAVDDDIANGAGWIVAIAATSELTDYRWGEYDPDVELPRLLCTTCHRAHRGLPNSPALVAVAESLRQDKGIETFCEVCHRNPPAGHHAYRSVDQSDTASTLSFTTVNTENLGHTYGSPQPDTIYCSHCHRAHNAGYGQNEPDFIPLLILRGTGLCAACHNMGVSHFLGDPTLPSTYQKDSPSLKRDPWPSGRSSYYDGEGEEPMVLTCLSCHDLSPHGEDVPALDHLLYAPASEAAEWEEGSPQQNLCAGCHSEAPSTSGAGTRHPLMEADGSKYPLAGTAHLLPGEIPVSYTENRKVNCSSCHVAHGATVPGGVYILKVSRGENIDPKAIHPKVDHANLCIGCHPYL